MTLKRLLELLKPFDGGSKEELIKYIQMYPYLKKELEDQLTEEYIKQIEEDGIYFIINMLSWKCKNLKLKKKIKLGYIYDLNAEKDVPCLSLNI